MDSARTPPPLHAEPGGGWSVASTGYVTKRHKRHDFAILLAIFRDGVHLFKKSTIRSPAYINETKTPTIFLLNKCPCPRGKNPCCRPGVWDGAVYLSFISALSSQLHLSCTVVPRLYFSCAVALSRANSRRTHLLTHRCLTAISRLPHNTKNNGHAHPRQ